MNAAQQLALAEALRQALDDAGIVVERAVFTRGNMRGYERMESLSVAARTIGLWMSWGWVAQQAGISLPPLGTPTSADPTQAHLRLMPTEVVEERRINNDDEDDGA